MHLDRRLLGWGLFFILLGAIPLLVRGNVLDAGVVDQWPLLWPFLLVGWGIGLILRNTPVSWIGGAIAVATLGIMGGGAIATGFNGIPVAGGCGDTGPGTAFQSRSGDLGSSARVTVEFNCGTLNVGTGDGSGWSVAGSDRVGRGPDVQSGGDSVAIRAQRNQNIFSDVGKATWNVTLPRAPQLAVGLTLNAGEANVGLGGANLSSLSMTLNAGSMSIDLGSATVGDVNGTVNAGSAGITLPAGDRSLNLTVNAGSLKVCLAQGSAVRVRWNGGLGSNNFESAGLTRQDEHTWVSSGFSATQAHTEMNVSANVGSFDLRFGGTCGA